MFRISISNQVTGLAIAAVLAAALGIRLTRAPAPDTSVAATPVPKVEAQVASKAEPKVETKVELIFDIENSSCLPVNIKERLNTKLANRIKADGTISVISQTERTQLGNKKKAEANSEAKKARFDAIAAALKAAIDAKKATTV